MTLYQTPDARTAEPMQQQDIPRHRAEELLAESSIALITLSGVTYTLRRTRAGKLILTK